MSRVFVPVALVVAAFCLWACGGVSAPPAETPEEAGPVSYSRDIQPMFDNFCISCHGTTRGLSLESYAGVMQGSQNGAVVRGGNPDESDIILRLEGRIIPRMPPMGALGADKIKRLRDWIAAGAPEN